MTFRAHLEILPFRLIISQRSVFLLDILNGSSIVEKKQLISEPERIGKILPGVMANIKKRINSQTTERNRFAVS